MGFNAAHSNYSCIYCTIKKDERLKNVKITINVPLKLYATSNRYIQYRYKSSTLSKREKKNAGLHMQVCRQETKLWSNTQGTDKH